MTLSLMRPLALAGLMLGLAPAAFAEEGPARLDDRSYFKSGQQVWEKTCARCHTTIDDKTDQSVGPDLSANEYDVDTLTYFVRNGYLAMPAFPESAISAQSLADLADYMAKNVYKGDAK